jgi:hypothetical protein
MIPHFILEIELPLQYGGQVPSYFDFSAENNVFQASLSGNILKSCHFPYTDQLFNNKRTPDVFVFGDDVPVVAPNF